MLLASTRSRDSVARASRCDGVTKEEELHEPRMAGGESCAQLPEPATPQETFNEFPTRQRAFDLNDRRFVGYLEGVA
nr:hypothetical protein BgiMline_001426 [Biomphalaria glabrata]